MNAELELAIVIDLNALIGTGGVQDCASEFRTSIFLQKQKQFFRFMLTGFFGYESSC
ncbi:MAG: hypothetical protein KBG15_17995 [Kofleriaceae bacterium]|nr:hypothetical protein [Kofleriaceae bacterium]